MKDGGAPSLVYEVLTIVCTAWVLTSCQTNSASGEHPGE